MKKKPKKPPTPPRRVTLVADGKDYAKLARALDALAKKIRFDAWTETCSRAY